MPYSVQRLIGTVVGVASLPLLLALMIVIRLDSPGNPLFKSPRIGRDGRPFTCFKLRTMRSREQTLGPRVSVAGDTRITRIGSILRRFRLDELPQVWNVARGEMLLVGPRPEDPRFVDLRDPLHRAVFMAMPGITGLTQLAFADEGTMIDPSDPERHYREVILPRKLALDADYLSRRSLRLDLWILGRTFLTAVGRRTSNEAIEARR